MKNARFPIVAISVYLIFGTFGCSTPTDAPIADSSQAMEEVETVERTEPSLDSAPVVPKISPESPWEADVEGLGLSVGDRFSLILPPGGETFSVWGTWHYTSDSSIGSAAVQSGLIDFEKGGTVVVEILEGRSFYIGSLQNGVSSGSWGSWHKSFSFVEDGERVFNKDYNDIGWDMTAEIFPMDLNITLDVLPGSDPRGLWGTDDYTSDSSIAAAAVHVGLIDFDGGTVTIRKGAGLDEYVGSQRNGIESMDYGPWGESFSFVP